MSKQPEGEWGGWRLHTLQEVLLHLLVETACHAEHLGRTGSHPRAALQ